MRERVSVKVRERREKLETKLFSEDKSPSRVIYCLKRGGGGEGGEFTNEDASKKKRKDTN